MLEKVLEHLHSASTRAAPRACNTLLLAPWCLTFLTLLLALLAPQRPSITETFQRTKKRKDGAPSYSENSRFHWLSFYVRPYLEESTSFDLVLSPLSERLHLARPSLNNLMVTVENPLQNCLKIPLWHIHFSKYQKIKSIKNNNITNHFESHNPEITIPYILKDGLSIFFRHMLFYIKSQTRDVHFSFSLFCFFFLLLIISQTIFH